MKRRPKSETAADVNRKIRASLRQDVLPPDGSTPRVKPVLVDWNLDRETVVMVGDARKLSIDLQAIKRESAEHYRIVYVLLVLLSEQSWVARDAVALANVELGMQSKRSSGGITTAKKRAAEREERKAEIEKAAASIESENPGIKKLALAAMLHDRGHGGREALRKKLPRKR